MWLHKRVRHQDGRQGEVVMEWVSSLGVNLVVECNAGDRHAMLLSQHQPSTGTKGWECFCDRWELATERGRWIVLPASSEA